MIKSICKKIMGILKVCDLFFTTQLVRYKEQPEFKSISGGICSLAVILAFIIIFTQTILNTFSKSAISSKTTLRQETEPSEFTANNNPFVFSLGIPGIDLNDNFTKYFNIYMDQRKDSNGTRQVTPLNLVPCVRQSWTKINQSYGKYFDQQRLSQFLCVQPNTTMYFQGKYSSDIFRYIKITVKTCSPTANDSRICANQSQIDQKISDAGGSLKFNYFFMNTIINADNSNYLDYYFDDKQYFLFSQNFGVYVNMFISTYQIQTDQSLWPINDYHYDKGGIIYEQTTQISVKAQDIYVQLYLRKSALTLSIQRSFQKYDSTLSYIGGLFTTIMAALIFFPKYNEYSYEIQIASKIYTFKKDQNIKTQYFNVFTFVAYLFYDVLNFIGKAPDWQILKHFDNVREEVGKQLDFRFIMKKLSFFEDCMQFLFEDYELKCLYLRGKMTLSQATQNRRRFSTRKKLLKIRKRMKQGQSSLLKSATQQLNHDHKLSNIKLYEMIPPQNKKDNVGIKLERENVEQIKEAKNMKEEYNHRLEEISRIQGQILQETEEDCSDLEEEPEQFYEKMMASIQKLQTKAMAGNHRCLKIMKSLDKQILNVLFQSKDKDRERDETSQNLNQSNQLQKQNNILNAQMVELILQDFQYLDDNKNN